ncbi:putative HTH cro/C1-type domain-containing protein [Gammaproteobacteria bacterium]
MTKGRQKSFNDYLKERLDETEIRRLQEAAVLEGEYFSSLKQEVNEAIRNHMEKSNMSKSKMANMLCYSDAYVQRVISGKHGFTMATIAHIGAAMGLKPHIIFQKEE